MEILAGPQIQRRPAVPTLGIRVVTPFRGMLATRDRLLAELTAWLDQHDVEVVGRFLLRLHVVDMSGPMDLEVAVTDTTHPGDDRVRPAMLPAGWYVTLAYRNHSIRANKALLDWAAQHSHDLDRVRVAAGDAFGCRTETYLTDPRREPRKTLWDVELAIRTAQSDLS